MTDQEIRDRLRDIDDGDQDVTSWEADFIESVAYRQDDALRPLTPAQRKSAEQMIEKYT